MRLKRYITEDQTKSKKIIDDIRDSELDRAGFRNIDPDDAEKLMAGMERGPYMRIFVPIRNLLEKDCSKFIKEMKGADGLIWRGTTGPMAHTRSFEQDVTKKSSHMDDSGDGQYGRRPKAYPAVGHELFNIISKKMYGWRFRNGVMTTGDFEHARQFGAQFIFFPIGNYQYLWHPQVRDFNMYELPVNGKALREFDGVDLNGPPDNVWRWFKMYERVHEEAYGGAYDYLKKNPDEVERITTLLRLDKFMAEYKDDGLKLGIDREREIVFNCKEYYLIHQFWAKKILEWLQT